jgi:Tol biopolymer transport system component
LTWFDREGRSQGQATEVGDYVSFRFSPDGRRLAFARVDPVTNTSDIWLMDVARHVETRLTFDPLTDSSPIWSPDGKRIVFRSDRAGGDFPFEKSSTGDEPERLMAPLDVAFPTDWSSDGKFILYHTTSHTRTSYGLMLFQVSDRKPAVFTNSTFVEMQGRFSPDGRWVAYASNESGRLEIYVQPFPRSAGKWRVSTGGGMEPRWRRDGKELYYLAPDGALMTVPANATSTFQSGTPRRLFQTRVPFLGSPYRSNYEVAGDGRFLVNTLVEGAASSPISVVLNWTTGLKK